MAPTAAKTFKFKVPGGKDARAESKEWTGPPPPNGVYRTKLKKLFIKPNNSGVQMLCGLAEIIDKDHPKARGYGIWFQQNIDEKGAPYVNQVLDAIGGGGDAGEDLINTFWAKGPTAVANEKYKGRFDIKRIGTFKVEGEDIEIMISGKVRKSTTYGDKLEARAYSPVLEDDSEDEDEEYEVESEEVSSEDLDLDEDSEAEENETAEDFEEEEEVEPLQGDEDEDDLGF